MFRKTGDSHRADTTTVQSIKRWRRLHWGQLHMALSPHQTPDGADHTLNIYRQVCVMGVWEPLPVWRQCWEITNSRGLMYSFQGWGFSPTRLIWWMNLCAGWRHSQSPIWRLLEGSCGRISEWPLWHFWISQDSWKHECLLIALSMDGSVGSLCPLTFLGILFLPHHQKWILAQTGLI